MKICSHCGFKVLDNQRYCPKCGFSVNSINNEEKKLNSNWDKIDDTAKIEMPIIPDTPHKKTLNKKLIITTIIISFVVLSTLTIILIYHNKDSNDKPSIEIGNGGGTTGDTGGDGGNTIDDKLTPPTEIDNTEDNGDDYNNNNTTKNDVNYYIEKYKDRDFIIPNSDSVKLTYTDLNSLSVEELFIARNEMFARYGYIFNNDDNLAKFFESKDWYSPDPNYSNELYSQIEEDNCKLIRSEEFTKLSYNSCPTITSDYVFPNSSSSLLSSSDFSEKSDWEIIIAINEIYARHGYSFSSVELNDYFESKPWYNNTHSNDITLSYIEDKNLKLLSEEREHRTKSALMHDLGK